MNDRRTGPGRDNQKRIAAVFISLKKAGRRGTYLSVLMAHANGRLDAELQIRTLSHLHYLLFGWTKRSRNTWVGGYLRPVIESVPGTPKNSRYVRLKTGVRKGDLDRAVRHRRGGARDS